MAPTFIVLASLVLPILSMPTTERAAAQDKSSLAPRQDVFPLNLGENCPHDTVDGRPQGQAHHHWQVTDNLSCGGAASCGTSKLKSHTFGIETSARISNVIGLTAGVSESWTSGETYTCNEDTDETVCVWINVAYTIFNMKTQEGCWDKSDVSAKFPNKDNAGGGYYCVTGKDCREMDANYWE